MFKYNVIQYASLPRTAMRCAAMLLPLAWQGDGGASRDNGICNQESTCALWYRSWSRATITTALASEGNLTERARLAAYLVLNSPEGSCLK